MKKKSGDLKHSGYVFIVLSLVLIVKSVSGGFNFYEESASTGSTGTVGRLVKKDERIPIVSTEFGEISAVNIDNGIRSEGHNYYLQFITLEPNSLFLPVLLHADMVIYVQTGSGKITWTDSDEIYEVSLKRGDIYRVKSGSLFYLHSSLEAERPRLRVIANFANPEEEQLQGPSIGPYSSINDLVRGFDKRILQAAFQVPEEVIEELTSATDTPAIVHAEPKRKNFWQRELQFINDFLGIHGYSNLIAENKKKYTKTFNFFKEDPDFENCNGWSTIVTKHNLDALKGSHIGVFMVNLTKGSMMGPHWNPMATEVSIVLEGEGMVRVVCPSAMMNKECKSSRFRIEEGDVFTVPRFHPMAQTSFNNGSLVFMGFSTTSKENHPQFIAGKASVLHTLSKPILRTSFNVSNTTIDQLLAGQQKAIILDCTSCAEEQEMLMEDEIETERKKEERRQQEEARKREEEKRRREEEEEERRKQREKEEQRRREEEEERKRQEEIEKQREEEERRRREEEERQRREEEERRRQKEEKEKRRQEEREKQREEEERRRQEEEERQRRQEEIEKKREEEERRRQKEEEKRRQEEIEKQREEEQRRRQEEEERQRRQEEIEKKRKEEERRKHDEEKRRQQEIEKKREEEERRRREEIEEKRKEEQRRQKEIEKQREKEEWRRQEEKERRRQEEIERQREEEHRKQQKEERRRQEIEEQKKQKEREKEERRRREAEEHQREEEEQKRQEEIERQREEEQRKKEKESGKEEGESEQEIARREEKEREEWQRQAEETARKREQGPGRRQW